MGKWVLPGLLLKTTIFGGVETRCEVICIIKIRWGCGLGDLGWQDRCVIGVDCWVVSMIEWVILFPTCGTVLGVHLLTCVIRLSLL